MFFFTPSIAPSNAIKRFIHADESIAWIFNHAAFAPCFFKSLTEQIPTCLSCSSKTFPILGSCDNFSKFYTSVNSNLFFHIHIITVPYIHYNDNLINRLFFRLSLWAMVLWISRWLIAFVFQHNIVRLDVLCADCGFSS